MRIACWLAAAVAAVVLPAGAACAQPTGVDKLYIFDCGHGHAEDQSRWSPGVNVGVPLDLSDNCYLIHHASGWLMWDTGVPDAVADMPNGIGGQNGAPSWVRPQKLATQLAAIGLSPSDIGKVAVSHTHPDHVGNVELFPKAVLLIQKAEYDWTMKSGNSRIAADHPVDLLDGDRDVFGDGSVMLVSTPGHTPGHQCLMVHLPKTGWIIFSGDATHFRENWEQRRVPGPNFDQEQTRASLQRIADLIAKYQAQLWINHDKPQSDDQRHSPEYYE